MKVLLYRFWQCTWGLVQTILGMFVFLKHRKETHYEYRGAIVTECEKNLNISLGMFIFVTRRRMGESRERLQKTISHEYGHTIQSLLLGPWYLLVIGLPSWLWCNLPCFRKMRKEKNISYSFFFTEKWADILGGIIDTEINRNY